jgi:hypothetical protein
VFSVTQIVLTAIAGLLFSGIGGALFQRWLARARPSIAITSVSFSGTEDLVSLDDRLISLSAADAWGETLHRYEPFDVLLQRDEKAAEVAERLRRAIALCEKWFEKYPPNPTKDDPPICLALDELKKHPYMIDDVVGSALIGMCKRNELGTIPHRLEVVYKCPRLTDLTKTKASWHLYLEAFGVHFPFDNMPSDARTKDVELMAESFARGTRQNIAHYTRRFVEQSKGEVLLLSDLRELLARTVVPEAHLSVRVSVYNAGKSATALRPHMGLKILHETFRERAFILSNRAQDQNQSRDPRAEPMPSKKGLGRPGKHVVVQGSLPETSSSPHISIAPGQALHAELVAIDALGNEDGERLKQIHSTGLLKCQVVAQTVSGQSVWSRPTAFSSRITDENKAELEKLVKKRGMGTRWFSGV